MPSQQDPYFLTFLADRNGQWASHRPVTWGVETPPPSFEQVTANKMPFCHPSLLLPGGNVTVIVGAPGPFWTEGNLDENHTAEAGGRERARSLVP